MKDAAIKLCIVGAAIAPLLWLSWIAAAPSGERTVSWVPGEFSSFITSPLPGDRVSEIAYTDDGDAYLSLIGEPTYIGVFPPSDAFTSATVSVEFDPHNAFAFELGGLTNVAAYAFDFHPLSNRAIESLGWSSLTPGESDLMVFARNDVKATVDDFLAHLPSRSSVVTYRATLPGVYRDASYAPIAGIQTFNASLRGSHEYLTYIKDEAFSLTVMYQDINRTYGADEGYVRVYNENGEAIETSTIIDDDDVSEDQVYTTRTLSLSIPNLPEGVYRVELSGTSDLVWRQFVTRQRYLSFKNKLYIADDVGYLASDRATTFVTNSKALAIETFHATSAKSLTIGNEVVEIPNSHELVRTVIDDEGTVSARTDRGDMKIVGEGKFAFSAQSFFDPDARSLIAVTDLADRALQYLITTLPPEEITADGWRSASATFTLGDLVKEVGAYKFALSLPGQAIDEEAVDIHKVSVTFHKAPISLTTAVYEEMRRWYRALRERLW